MSPDTCDDLNIIQFDAENVSYKVERRSVSFNKLFCTCLCSGCQEGRVAMHSVAANRTHTASISRIDHIATA
jgi:hypothetical protein